MSQELIQSNTFEMTRAEIDITVATAKKYPRDIAVAIQKAEALATMNEDIAQSCFYSLPRTDKDKNKIEIVGPSVRLAEIFASQWTNLRIGARIISNDGRHITVEGVVFDTESNLTYLAPIQLAICGKNKNGDTYTYNENMQQTITGAAVAKATRNAIFKAIPLAFVLPVMEKAIKASIGDQKTLDARRTDTFEKLLKMGIDKQKILDYYGKPLNEFTADDVRSMMGAGAGIKEGHIKIDEAFCSVEAPKNKSDQAKERLDNLTTKKDTLVNKETGEVVSAPFSFDSIKRELQTAKTADALHLAADKIREITEIVLQEELQTIYKARLTGFGSV